MAILVDLNQVVLSNLMQQLNIIGGSTVEEGFLRHMILSSLRSYKKKFGEEYGELVICNDTGNYWRKEIFPQYKANRKRSQENSEFDWNLIFAILNKIKSEIRENFPYKFISIPRCEADDIIAVLSKELSTRESVLIVSGDKDFVQLFKFPGVSQYSPVLKKFITEADPEGYLRNKIIYGDPGDGIPNIASDDKTFVEGRRQRRVGAKLISEGNANLFWKRNEVLIDFSFIPEWAKTEILEGFKKPAIGTKESVHKYLQNNSMKLLLAAHGEF